MSTQTQPDWNGLFEIASTQEGMFTTQQAAQVGYSPQLLVHHLTAGRLVRVRRSIYRLVHFPPGDHEDLVQLWLWSEQEGIFSHQTALALHNLSDEMPATVHMTLPQAWKKRRLRTPPRTQLHHQDLAPDALSWFGAIPATSALQTLVDCANASLSPESLRMATQEALRRGLVERTRLKPVEVALLPYGGL